MLYLFAEKTTTAGAFFAESSAPLPPGHRHADGTTPVAVADLVADAFVVERILWQCADRIAPDDAVQPASVEAARAVARELANARVDLAILHRLLRGLGAGLIDWALASVGRLCVFTKAPGSVGALEWALASA